MPEGHRRSTSQKLVATVAIASVVSTMFVTMLFASPALAQQLGAQSKQRNTAQHERRHVRSRARSQIGAPYSYGGTSPHGFDCSGFTRWTFERLSNLPHSSSAQFDLAQRRGYKRIWKRSRLKVGDLVFHHTTSARVGHAGIYIGHGRFISATTSDGVRVRSLFDRSYWGPRWVGGTRVPATQN